MLNFCGPSEKVDSLIGQAIFGDGAGAIIVGSDPELKGERGLFKIVMLNVSS